MLLRLILLVNSALGLTVLSSLDFWLLSMLFPSPKFIYAIQQNTQSPQRSAGQTASPLPCCWSDMFALVPRFYIGGSFMAINRVVTKERR